MQTHPTPPAGGDGPVPESTASLLARVRQGDGQARDALLLRYLPVFMRWAHGRLPARARDVNDTDDLVQVSLMKALKHVDRFEPRHEGAFLAYLRQILMNEVRQELRRVDRRPIRVELPEDLPGREPSPLEALIGRRSVEAYEEALAQLTDEQREAVLLRMELGFSHQEVARAIGSPTANAARMLVKRALLSMAEWMEGDEDEPR